MSKARKKSAIARDRRNIAKLYLKGELQADIAEQLGISQSTVSRDLSAIQKQWQEANSHDINERKSMELAKIDNLELEYWDAWKRSQEDAELRTKKAVETNGETRKEAQERIEGQVGNPAFLRGIEWCINKRCELLGLDAPKKTDFTSGGKEITIVPLGVKIEDV